MGIKVSVSELVGLIRRAGIDSDESRFKKILDDSECCDFDIRSEPRLLQGFNHG